MRRFNYIVLKNLHIKKWQEKSIKVESQRSFREEMNVLGIQDSDVFQIQLVEYAKRERKRILLKIIEENSLLTYKYHN
ncbi:hypothetical protein CN917_29065 [Bacillus thuringiensis]|nr:hypothetical protein CN479_29065 [Bacillus thuringiensis]TKH51444.1 hypothetical protein FC698_02150 [Bacillus cereus]PFD59752.1 hypothetical protein CN274_08770 [Bacillus thuringiensis]PFK55054.1 hypothetical protein COJ09_23220 [Bacillus thuringiensis]PFN92164.1 hypothetical protein COJ67_03465 [Bacillus thuringiensis]